MANDAHRSPVFVTLMGLGCVAMLAPAIFALSEGDHASARAFFYSATLAGFLTLLIGLVTRRKRSGASTREQLLTLLGAYTVLPLLLAFPVEQAVQDLSLMGGWFEMISAITTTGATLFDDGAALPRAVHLWRAEVAWLGGYFVWVTAAAILAPMNLGGFEVRALRHAHLMTSSITQTEQHDYARLKHTTLHMFPIYGGLTLALWVGLLIGGEDELVALTHAMSVMSTSGISPVGGMGGAQSGFVGEMLILCFFIFALSRVTFARTSMKDDNIAVLKDPEVQLGLALIGSVTAVLFLHHWIGAADIAAPVRLGFEAFWGALFTVASFLTTTGFESSKWTYVGYWTGLQTPGLVLIGLAIMGGGVATTAGGVKLMRVFALGQHMRKEVQGLILPSSVGAGGERMRQIGQRGAYIAWIMFMLFAMSIAAVMIALAFTGVQFEDAMVLAVAALTNCGPLAQVAAEYPIAYTDVPPASRIILAIAMVVGRLESLAIIALINVEIWRK